MARCHIHFFYKNQIIFVEARCSYSRMAKISNFAHTLPYCMRLKCFSGWVLSLPTIQWFVTLPVLELPLQMDANLSLTVLIMCVLIKEKSVIYPESHPIMVPVCNFISRSNWDGACAIPHWSEWEKKTVGTFHSEWDLSEWSDFQLCPY